MAEVGWHFSCGDWDEAKDVLLVKKAWLTMSRNEGRSCGRGVRICCTSSGASRDGNSY